MKFIKKIFSRKTAKAEEKYPCKDCLKYNFINYNVSTEEARKFFEENPISPEMEKEVEELRKARANAERKEHHSS